jgi:hypothetical protein
MSPLGWLFLLAGAVVVLVVGLFVGPKYIRRRLTRASYNRYYEKVRALRKEEQERASKL